MIIQFPPEWSDEDWAAVTTSNQFRALGEYSTSFRNNCSTWKAYQNELKFRKKDAIDKGRIKSLLVNSWNTEYLLRQTLENFSGPNNGFVAQWAFPQAYYSTFNSTLASFAASGFTERTHSAVRKKVADFASCGKYPAGLNVFASGSRKDIQISGMESTLQDFKSTDYTEGDAECIKRHLISFFKTTRKHHLENKKSTLRDNQKLAMGLKRKDGRPKTSFNNQDWEKVSASIGKTSWLCLLYRKRIQSNYRDIETFLSEKFETGPVLEGLKQFTDTFNLANEINITHKLELDIVLEWIPERCSFVNERLDFISQLAA